MLWLSGLHTRICSLLPTCSFICFPGRNTLKNSTVYGTARTSQTSQSLLSLFLSKIVLVWILMLTSGLNPRITCWVGIWSIQNFRSLTRIFETQKPFVICGAGPEISIYENYMQRALLPRKAEKDNNTSCLIYSTDTWSLTELHRVIPRYPQGLGSRIPCGYHNL